MPEEPHQPMPAIPPGITRSEFGNRVMSWGTGNEAALARIETISAEWLVQHRVTVSMLEIWLRFYERVYAENPENPSARGRAELVRHCLSLLGGVASVATTARKLTRKAHLRIANPHDTELTLVLEPWGETYAIAPHGSLDVIGSGPPGDALEVSFDGGVVRVWGWPGSVLHVEADGLIAEPRPTIPVPGL